MRSTSTTTVSELRERLPAIVDAVVTTGEVWTITRHGHPVAAVLSYEEYESLVETLNILSDREMMADLESAEREAASGDVTPLAEAIARIQAG